VPFPSFSIGSSAGDCAPAPSHTTGRAVFRIRSILEIRPRDFLDPFSNNPSLFKPRLGVVQRPVLRAAIQYFHSSVIGLFDGARRSRLDGVSPHRLIENSVRDFRALPSALIPRPGVVNTKTPLLYVLSPGAPPLLFSFTSFQTAASLAKSRSRNSLISFRSNRNRDRRGTGVRSLSWYKSQTDLVMPTNDRKRDASWQQSLSARTRWAPVCTTWVLKRNSCVASWIYADAMSFVVISGSLSKKYLISILQTFKSLF